MTNIMTDWRITKSISWGFDRIFALLGGVCHIFLMFFLTLLNPGTSKQDMNHSGFYGPSSRPPRPPSRRIGRPNLGSNVNVPFPGGCSSCAR